MDWKNFKKNGKSFGTALKIWHKDTCGGEASSETNRLE